jgi:hypothetical protein
MGNASQRRRMPTGMARQEEFTDMLTFAIQEAAQRFDAFKAGACFGVVMGTALGAAITVFIMSIMQMVLA